MICSHCEKNLPPKYQQEAVYSLEHMNKTQEKEFLCEEHTKEAIEFGLIYTDNILITSLNKEKK